jgi:hypothetical protein
MIWDSFLRFLVDLAWFAGLWMAGAILFALLGKLRRWLPTGRLGWWIRSRRVGRRSAPSTGHGAPPLPERTGWSVALLVRSSGDALAPSVQVRGSTLPGPARIRIDLIDPAGGWHRASGREVSDPDLGREVSLPPFSVPEGHRVEEVLTWLWRVVLELEDEECVLCLEQLRPMDGLNAEAEIGAPTDAPV